MADGLGLAAEVRLDSLLASGVLGGDVQELSRCAWGLMAKHVDECLAGRATDKGVDDIDAGDVGELIALLGEMLDVLPEGLARPLPAVVEVPRVLGPSVRTLEVADEDITEIALVVDVAGLELLEPSSSRAS